MQGIRFTSCFNVLTQLRIFYLINEKKVSSVVCIKHDEVEDLLNAERWYSGLSPTLSRMTKLSKGRKERKNCTNEKSSSSEIINLNILADNTRFL